MGDKRKDRNISVADIARTERKLQEEKDGDRVISDHSATALKENAFSFEELYREQHRRAGSKRKIKEGIWLAVKEIRERHPDMDAQAVWHNLHGYRVGTRWSLDIEDDYIYQDDSETGKSQKIKFNTYSRHYYSKVLKK